MTDPIPDEAVEEAAQVQFFRRTGLKSVEWGALPEVVRSNWRAVVTPLVEAAAPSIAAQATQELRDGIKALLDEWWSTPLSPSDARLVAILANALDALLDGA